MKSVKLKLRVSKLKSFRHLSSLSGQLLFIKRGFRGQRKNMKHSQCYIGSELWKVVRIWKIVLDVTHPFSEPCREQFIWSLMPRSVDSKSTSKFNSNVWTRALIHALSRIVRSLGVTKLYLYFYDRLYSHHEILFSVSFTIIRLELRLY